MRLNKIVLNAVAGLVPEVGDKWLGDELVAKVNGKRNYLWNILDFETRFHVVSFLAEGRSETEARNAIAEAFRRTQKEPKDFVSDGLASY